jgi:hypothetical protein
MEIYHINRKKKKKKNLVIIVYYFSFTALPLQKGEIPTFHMKHKCAKETKIIPK